MNSRMEADYHICSRCVMDTTDPNISFNSNGECNHCVNYLDEIKVKESELKAFECNLKELKERPGKYNCIVGVSGGLDSTFLLLHAVKDLGLRPLAVHVDNGWNTGLAANNIANLVKACGTDLYTNVLNWEEFKRMQIAILQSGTPDLEAATDLFINYSLREAAYRHNIPCIISGTNPQTEAIMGSTWSYGQRDPVYLKGLYETFNNCSPVRLPFKSVYKSLYEQLTSKIIILRPLRYIDYSRNYAVERSTREANWIEYPRKHGESFITRFYQDYFLPTRFGADKRRAHLSNLIMNGEISRANALDQLSTPMTDSSIEADIDYFCTKLGLSRHDFDCLMNGPKHLHEDYKTMKDMYIYKLGLKVKFLLGADNGFTRYLVKLISH